MKPKTARELGSFFRWAGVGSTAGLAGGVLFRLIHGEPPSWPLALGVGVLIGMQIMVFIDWLVRRRWQS